MNAEFFLKLPLWSRKCCGLKVVGVAHCFPSFSTECNKGIMMVFYVETTNCVREVTRSNLFLIKMTDSETKRTLGIV